MRSDMFVALGPATVDGRVLFGFNGYSPMDRPLRLRRIAGRSHAPGESVEGLATQMAQARQTYTVVGCQEIGVWGLVAGYNERHVAMGVCCWRSRLAGAEGGLAGADLVRLTLERSHSANHAVETVTELIGRHGVGAGKGGENGVLFLIADGKEAMIVEAAGRYWAMLEVQSVRAVSDVALIRQDWQRIAPGLSALAMEKGWWEDGASKIDFAGCLAAPDRSHFWALKRWGRATLLLEQQNGHIDHEVLRRLVAEHYEAIGRIAGSDNPRRSVVRTLMVALTQDEEAPPLAWWSIGPPRQGLYFPVLAAGELPEIFAAEAAGGLQPLRGVDAPENVQLRWDNAVVEFVRHTHRPCPSREQVQRQATQFMNLLAAGLVHEDQPASRSSVDHPRAPDEELAFVSE